MRERNTERGSKKVRKSERKELRVIWRERGAGRRGERGREWR